MTEWRIVAIVVLVATTAFFAASETALFALRQHQLRRLRTSPARAAAAVRALLEHPRRVLVTVLVGNITINLLLGVLATGPFVDWLGPERGTLAATLVTTVLVLVFGEIAPKTLAVGRPLGVALRVAGPLRGFQQILRPVSGGLVRLADGVSAALVRRTRPREEALTTAEIKTLVTMGWESGVVGAREKEFIHNVFHLDDRLVSEIVTPRQRIFALDLETSMAQACAETASAGFSRVPLYAGTVENLVGYVEATELLWGRPEPDPRQLRDLRRHLPFYPEVKPVGELLAEMRRKSEEMAGVIDEHGGLAGIVSLEDAVEQVVGEIFDLHDLDRFRYTEAGDELVVVAQMEIPVFNRLLDTNLQDENAETVGGFVINRLGRIPEPGTQLDVAGLRFTVDKAAPNRIVTLRVRRLGTEKAA